MLPIKERYYIGLDDNDIFYNPEDDLFYGILDLKNKEFLKFKIDITNEIIQTNTDAANLFKSKKRNGKLRLLLDILKF